MSKLATRSSRDPNAKVSACSPSLETKCLQFVYNRDRRASLPSLYDENSDMALLTARDRTEAKRLQRATLRGSLRRIYPRVYTADTQSPLEPLVRRELYGIIAALAPDALSATALLWSPTPQGRARCFSQDTIDVKLNCLA